MYHLAFMYRHNQWYTGFCWQVKWARENYSHDLGSPYTLRLASADNIGNIIIWDVVQGEPKTEFSDGTKPIQGSKI